MFTSSLTFTESEVLMVIYLFFITDIQNVEIELMNKKFGEASKVEVCVLLDFLYTCSNNITFTVDLLILQIPGL